jgi:hypothetical protein
VPDTEIPQITAAQLATATLTAHGTLTDANAPLASDPEPRIVSRVEPAPVPDLPTVPDYLPDQPVATDALAQHLKAWIRREIALVEHGYSAEQRVEMNP